MIAGETTWWPGWRHLLEDRLPLVVVIAIATTSLGGYLAAWWLGRKVDRYERRLREHDPRAARHTERLS